MGELRKSAECVEEEAGREGRKELEPASSVSPPPCREDNLCGVVYLTPGMTPMCAGKKSSPRIPENAPRGRQRCFKPLRWESEPWRYAAGRLLYSWNHRTSPIYMQVFVCFASTRTKKLQRQHPSTWNTFSGVSVEPRVAGREKPSGEKAWIWGRLRRFSKRLRNPEG